MHYQGSSPPLGTDSICDVSPCRLTQPDDLHHLAALEAVVTGDGVCHLDLRKLRLLEFVPRQHLGQGKRNSPLERYMSPSGQAPVLYLLFLLGRQDHMLRHECVLRYVDKELCIPKHLQPAKWPDSINATPHGRQSPTDPHVKALPRASHSGSRLASRAAGRWPRLCRGRRRSHWVYCSRSCARRTSGCSWHPGPAVGFSVSAAD
jgi:hypothetical protein